MMRFVSVDIQKGVRFYHFEDREAKEAYELSEKEIITKSAQLNNSSFTDTMLGVAWGEDDASKEDGC